MGQRLNIGRVKRSFNFIVVLIQLGWTLGAFASGSQQGSNAACLRLMVAATQYLDSNHNPFTVNDVPPDVGYPNPVSFYKIDNGAAYPPIATAHTRGLVLDVAPHTFFFIGKLLQDLAQDPALKIDTDDALKEMLSLPLDHLLEQFFLGTPLNANEVGIVTAAQYTRINDAGLESMIHAALAQHEVNELIPHLFVRAEKMVPGNRHTQMGKTLARSVSKLYIADVELAASRAAFSLSQSGKTWSQDEVLQQVFEVTDPQRAPLFDVLIFKRDRYQIAEVGTSFLVELENLGYKSDVMKIIAMSAYRWPHM